LPDVPLEPEKEDEVAAVLEELRLRVTLRRILVRGLPALQQRGKAPRSRAHCWGSAAAGAQPMVGARAAGGRPGGGAGGVAAAGEADL